MTTMIVSLLCKIDMIEHIRAAVYAAREYERESMGSYPDRADPDLQAISL